MKKLFIPLISSLFISAAACSTGSDTAVATPEWLESDSAQAMHQRLLADFPMTFDEAVAAFAEKYPQLTADSVRRMIDAGYIETMQLDGQERVFRKAVRNMPLLNPEYNDGWKHRGYNASAERISYVDSVIKYSKGLMADGAAHRVELRFHIDVPYHPSLKDDTLRVWMPFPIKSDRQTDIKILNTSQDEYVLSSPDNSVHRTIYMQAPVVEGDTAHFEYTVELVTKGRYFDPESIMANMKPYDTSAPDYKKYTSFDGPHYLQLDSLAKMIVGDETNPYKQSELVYDYIINHYPWAGAREYSTIECIPQYVIDTNHGDCGQVALLYISLMRTLGVPARWESGWMLHPGEKNYHDWAEVYFEGTGWVPVDVSFGRYTTSDDPAVQNFYSTGIDAHRFATNTGVSGKFFPEKKYIRSETVDLQAGEVECSKGNLYYKAWDSGLDILSAVPVAL